MGPDRAHPIMEALAEPADYYADHLNFIRHGREVCRSMRPACGRCFLSAHCHYFQQEQEKAK
jgi:endonuclease-3